MTEAPPIDDWVYKIKNKWEDLHLQLKDSSRNHTDYDILQKAISEVLELVDNAKNIHYD